MDYAHTAFASPVGRLTLVGSDRGLVAVLWENDDPARVRIGAPVENNRHPVLVEVAEQLGDYFAGRRTRFDVPLDFRGTDFQKSVWSALLTIPFGETRTYAEIARQIGRPTAFRAVGAANGRNPVSIIAPCHRVIGSDGSLTGFAGGLEAKNFLLRLEGDERLQGSATNERQN
jgi:methylated-DNA-[protein]-cysteine S-methyltransferase